VWIHLKQRSHCMRFGYAESPSPMWHWRHGGSSSSGVKGLSVENNGDIWMWVVRVPLSSCAFVTWRGHVSGYHSTRYGVVRLGIVLRQGCFCGPCCRMRATGIRWVRVRLFCDCGLGMKIGIMFCVRYGLGRLLGRGFILT
jgi:hypothetical protein